MLRVQPALLGRPATMLMNRELPLPVGGGEILRLCADMESTGLPSDEAKQFFMQHPNLA
jgi:hypothetical protein